MTTWAERNLAAEVRAVEEGHRCVVQDDGSFLVVSDTHHGKAYRVDALPTYAGGLITFLCQPEGTAAFADDHATIQGEPGIVPCKHTALLARRLERAGLAVLNPYGQWQATAKAGVEMPAIGNPLEGLPV